ncbi:hypothetical protein V3N99_05635 [Dermatophilaceae bacterium Soc4.6]
MGGGTPSTDIGPGLGAFVAFFALALLLWLLMRNMNGRMRRMAYVERERVTRLQERDAELRGETPAVGGAAGSTTGSGDSPEPGPGSEPVPGRSPHRPPSPRGDDDEHEPSAVLDR